MDVKNLPISIDMETGEYVDLETQLELREKYGDNPPLFINYDHNGQTTKK